VTTRANNKYRLTGLFTGLAAFVLVLLWPEGEQFGGVAKATTAVSLLMALWWLTEAIPIPVTSLLPLVLFPLLGIATVQDAASPYSNHLVYLFLGGFILALGIERVNLHKRIALRIISITGSSPIRLVLGFMIASAFLSMWISNTATTLMMLPVALAVIRELASVKSPDGTENQDKTIIDNFGMSLLLGIAYAASIGGTGTLIGTPPNIVLAGLLRNLYPELPEIGFFRWMIFTVPVILIFLPVAWFLLVKIIPRQPLHRLALRKEFTDDLINRELKKLGPVSVAERRMIFVFLLTTIGWTFRAPLEMGFLRVPGVTDLLPGIADSTIAMLAGISLFVIPSGTEAGRYIMDWDTVRKGIPWGILLLFGGGFSLAEGLSSSGVTLLLGEALASLRDVPVPLMIVLVCALLTFVTELTSNTATSTILIPVVGAAAVSLGQNPMLFMIPATLSASYAFMLPVATPPNAIVFSIGWFSIRQMARAGFLLNLTGILLITLMMYLVGLPVFSLAG